MKVFRRLLIVAGMVLGLAVLVGLAAMTSGVQTWAARRAVAGQPRVEAEIGRVKAGLHRVEIEGVRARYAGAVLTLPRLEVELPLIEAGWNKKIAIGKLVARGWTLDLTAYAALPGLAVLGDQPAAAPFSVLSTAYAAPTPATVKTIFQGIFSQLRLPVDLLLDGVVLEGEVIIPARQDGATAKVEVSVIGGGLRSGHEGVFELTSRVERSGDAMAVTAMRINGTVSAVMDSPRTFTKVAALLNGQVTGPAIPHGVQLTVNAAALSVPGGESYAVTLHSVGKRLLDVQANFPTNSSRLGGVWRLDMRDTDVAPFTLGLALPAFEAVGAGMFETDTGFAEIHTAGRIKSSADRLHTLVPELEEVGAVTVFAEFDLMQRDQVTRIDNLTVAVNRADPVLSVRSLQAFEFNVATGELKVADPSSDLVAIDLHGVPVGWVRPFVPAFQVRGGPVIGRFTASARNGGLALRSTAPLQADNISVSEHGQTLVEQVAVAVNLSVDYTPTGWQGDVSNLTVSDQAGPLLTLAVKAGQLSGDRQTIKATGQLKSSLPALLRQPFLKDSVALTRGELKMDFAVNWGAKQELQGRVGLTDLMGPEGALPTIGAEARVTVEATGNILFEVPLTFAHTAPKRTSDLTLEGTLQPRKDGYRVDGRLSGSAVYLEDLQLLGGIAVSAPKPTTKPDGGDETPFWDGVSGQVSLAFRKLFYPDQFEMSDVRGAIGIEPGAVKLDGVKARIGEGGEGEIDGEVTFTGTDHRPYLMAAKITALNVDSAPLFKALKPTAPPPVEGRFTLNSSITAKGRNVADLVDATTGDIHLTSKGGVFRLLSADVTANFESVSKVAAVGAFLGSFAGALTKGGNAAGFANKAQAVSELAKALTAIRYDQLNVVVNRDDQHNTVMKDFTLIAPEIRLVGAGQLSNRPGANLLELPLTLEMQMKARGNTGVMMKYLGIIDEQKDELGYASSQLPLRVAGTLAQPDTSAVKTALVNLAVEKSGAGDLLNRLLGK